jgi:hypothetical protein
MDEHADCMIIRLFIRQYSRWHGFFRGGDEYSLRDAGQNEQQEIQDE